MKPRSFFLTLTLMLAGFAAADDKPADFRPLFTKDGPPEGFSVKLWSDVSKPGPGDAAWAVKDGVLQSQGERGNWLISDKEYGDFILEYEFKLGPTGNSGCALRAPAQGDPAFDGLELQMADFRYNPKARDSELTGGFYRAVAPKKQLYKPEEWNSMRVELRGQKAKVTLNGEVIQDIDFSTFTETVARHDGTAAPPLKDRPLKGRIGFQNLSRGGSPVTIRNAKIKELPAA